MQTLATIYEFRTANFIVRVDALEEIDLDLPWDDTGEVAEKLDNGQLVAFCAKAAVLFRGTEIGADYLGNCIYESFDGFRHDSGYFHDMVSLAIRSARDHFKDLPALRAA
jgi:hypothetical protein